jgi:hypothetical protein
MNHYVSLSLTKRKSSVHLHALYSPRTALRTFTPRRDQLVICGQYEVLVEVYRRFRGSAYIVRHTVSIMIALMMEAVSTSKRLSSSTRLHGATSQKTVTFKVQNIRQIFEGTVIIHVTEAIGRVVNDNVSMVVMIMMMIMKVKG